MKARICLAVMMMAGFAASAAWAQEEERPRREEMRERMIEEFDADGDGRLNDEERQTAREAMRQRRGGPEGRGRGPGQGQGQRREGRPAPPDPNQLFDEFDENKDGQLSRDEFMKLHEARPDRRPPRPPREGRPEADDEGRAGPPRGEREFGRRPPFQNEIDGPPGRPPRREAGPGPRGPEGRGPDLNRLFDRFDEDGDDQLSREEFMKLSDALREMRERFADGGPRRRGPREGVGPPEGRGPREGRPPRPQRPGSRLDADFPAEDNASI